MSALIPSPYPRIPGRPLYVEHENGKVWVLFHDHYHLETRKKLVKELQEAHPDTSGRALQSGAQARRLQRKIRAFHEWQNQEIIWYGQLDLPPPSKKVVFRLVVKSTAPTVPLLKNRFAKAHWTRRPWRTGPHRQGTKES